MPHLHPAPTVTAIPDAAARWAEVWATLGVSPPPGALDDLLRAWCEPQRRYHTLEHLLECLDAFDEARPLCRQPGEVALALWFHDAVYDPAAPGSNELKSAYLAERAMATAGCPRDTIGRVRGAILATRHQAPPETTDEALVLDIDLAILGSLPARYDRFEADIREEYHAIPWLKYIAARRQVLRGFLERPRLYWTGDFHDRLDAPARANLSRALKRLPAG